MGVIATAAKFLIQAGVSGDELITALEEIEDAGAPALDEQAERRRAKDRERKRLRNSAESAEDTKDIVNSNIYISKKTISRIVPQTSAETRFPEFRAAYPKRSGQYAWPKAEKKFNHLVSKGIPPDEIIEGVRRYADLQNQLGKVGTEYIQMPTTWLNGEMWKDVGDCAVSGKDSFEDRYNRAVEAFRNGTKL